MHIGQKLRHPVGSVVIGITALSCVRIQAEELPALQGFCPVSIVKDKEWVPGAKEFKVEYDGTVYWCANDEQMHRFDDSPELFVPAYGGMCVPCAASLMPVLVPGNIHHAVFFEGRLFLFTNDETESVFSAIPEYYADFDLGHGGLCAVALSENKYAEGLEQFTVIKNGVRYRFSTADRMQQFEEDPTEFLDEKFDAIRPRPTQ